MTEKATKILGLPENLSGTPMIRRAVEMVAAVVPPNRPQMIEIYAAVGREFGATMVQAERNMRNAVRKAGYVERLSQLLFEWALEERKVQSGVKKNELLQMLRGYAEGTRHTGNVAGADLVAQAADQIETLLAQVDELELSVENYRQNLRYAREDQQKVEDDRDHLLKIAKKMHLWIFRHSVDEYAAYKECGLTDEDDIRLGYGGQFVIAGEGNT